VGKTKDKRLRRIYKITEAEQDRVREEQGNRCAICDKSFSKYIAFQDHFHGHCPRKLKEFCGLCNRGLLCFGCNKYVVGVIERQKVDPNRVAAYLNKWGRILMERGVYPKEKLIGKK